MPVLMEHDRQVLVIGDEVENYFRGLDPTVEWGRDFAFLGNLNH